MKIGTQATITDKEQVRDYLSDGNIIVDRGYTSHEHFAEVGLIHMNGRLYDPLLRRFLNADENVQDPHNTQNYNKYGYVLNNPLMYNDPSGEFFLAIPVLTAIIIGAAVGLASYVITGLITGQDISLLGAFKATLFGAVSGAVTFGIGDIFAPAIKSAAQMSAGLVKAMTQTGYALAQAVAHGVAQGALSLMQGGNATMGAISGAFGSLGASAFGAGMKGLGLGEFAKSGAGTVLSGMILGGVGSELLGGNFWEGALIGGIVAGLNHAMHKMDSPFGDNDDGDDPKPKKKGFLSKKQTNTIESANKIGAFAEAGVEFIKEGMLEIREAMPLNKKIGSFKTFSKYFKYVKTAENGIALFTGVGNVASVLVDYNSYLNGDISGAVLTYRTVGNVASFGAGKYTGPIGSFGVSYIFSSGERLLNRIATEMTRINNSNGYFLNNFHP